MVTLRAFDPYPLCCKCGHDGVDIRYTLRRHDCVYLHDEHEWLAYTCRRCGYTWDSRCIPPEGSG